MSKWVVVAPPSRAMMAMEFAGLRGYSVIIASVNQFADKNPNFAIPRLHELNKKRVYYFADWSDPHARYVDLCLLWPIAELMPTTLDIVIPFMGSATMERETFEGEIATANVDAKLLSALPAPSKTIHLIDLHTLQNQFYFHGCAVRMHSFCTRLPSSLVDDAVIVFPDEGASKRFKSLFPHNDIAVFSKVRDGDKRILTLVDGDVNNRKTCIIDDLVRTGGTLGECARALRTLGASSVGVFVSHIAFTDHIPDVFTTGLFDFMHTTDSAPPSVIKLIQDTFNVHSIAAVFRPTISQM